MIASLANFCVALVALLHLTFLVLEMFLWEKALGRRVFRQSPERAAITRQLALNQGLYNGFLAAGLLWGLFLGSEGFAIKVFFLCCIVIAGVVGAATVSRGILWIQAAPAALGLAMVLLAT
jgi:putative membrane protein